MKFRFASCIFAFALFAAPLVAQTETPDSLALGRKFTSWMVDGHADSLWNAMDEATRRRIGNFETIETMVPTRSAAIRSTVWHSITLYDVGWGSTAVSVSDAPTDLVP